MDRRGIAWPGAPAGGPAPRHLRWVALDGGSALGSNPLAPLPWDPRKDGLAEANGHRSLGRIPGSVDTSSLGVRRIKDVEEEEETLNHVEVSLYTEA